MENVSVNVNTNVENANVEVKAEYKAPAKMLYQVNIMTAQEYAEDDTVAIPLFQRGVVWTEKQFALLADSLEKGIPLQPMLRAHIVSEDGEMTVNIDGLQRLSAMKWMIEQYNKAIEDGDEYAIARWETILSRDVMIITIECDSVQDAALLFARYNSGSPLSAIQRGKSGIPANILARLSPWTEWSKLNLPAKCGSVSRDSAALMLAAGLVADTNHLSSSGVTACKTLTKADVATVPGIVPACMAHIMVAIDGAGAGDYGSNYWVSPSRMVPLLRAVVDTNATPDAIASVVKGFSALQGVSCNVPSFARGKDKSKTQRRSVSAIFSDTSSGPKATGQRYSAICKLLRGEYKRTAEDVDPQAQAVADILAAAMRGEG